MDTCMATRKRAKAAIEWVTGIVSLPSYVTGEGEPYHPELLLWIDPDGLIVGMDTARPGALIQRIAAHFHATTRRPMMGPAHVPTRIRVASPEVADTLRAALGKAIEIVRAPTPELDTIVAAMIEKMNANDELQSYLTPGISADAMAAFFRAAAGLFRSKPWSVVPADDALFSITVEALGVRDAVISTIGQAGESFGLILFPDIDAFNAFLDISASMEQDEEPDLPPHFAITFDSEDALSPAALDEIAEHRWEVASAEAYPLLSVVDAGVVMRAPTAEDLTLAEVIALAIPQVLAEKQELLRAWDEGKALMRTLTVTTHAGPIEVTLGALGEGGSFTRDESAPADLMGAFTKLRPHGGELDSKAREALEAALLTRFDESPEAEPLDVIDASQIVMEFAADYFGETIATLTPAHLREIVFEIIPRKLSTEASEAGPIITELRAFFAFLQREFGLPQADACLAVLGGDATARLTRALSDPRNFGMAKSIMMGGLAAGFDISSREGAEASIREAQGKLLPGSVHVLPLPARPTRAVDPAAEKAKKNKRKAERQARKKSR